MGELKTAAGEEGTGRDPSPRTATRIVSFLGLGNRQLMPDTIYEPCRYELDGRTSAVSPLTTAGLLEVAAGDPSTPGSTSVVVLGTHKVRELWFDESRRFGSMIAASGFDVPIGFVELPEGRHSGDLWLVFDRVLSAVAGPALEAEGDGGLGVRIPAATRILVDVTHGYRSQPLFAAAAIAFARSQDRRAAATAAPARSRESGAGPPASRLETGEGPDIRLLYGAHDAAQTGGEKKVVPFWDLTLFLEVLQWDAAIDGLMRYGQAGELGTLIQSVQQSVPPHERRSLAPLRQLKEAAQVFADDLATIRLPRLLQEDAKRLADACAAASSLVLTRIPPLGRQLEELTRWARSIATETVVSPDGVRAALALARLYEGHHRPAELAAVLRETLATAYTVETVPSTRIEQPRAENRAFVSQRDAIERELGALKDTKGSDWGTKWDEIACRRNDVLHAGFNADAAPSARIRTSLADALGRIEEFLEGRPPAGSERDGTSTPPPPDRPASGRFVNFSNHPVAGWSREQRAAALRLADHGEVIDLPGGPFLVAPDATCEKVTTLARALSEEILALSPTVVHAMGEHGLVHAVVAELQRRGVRVVSSTTNRAVDEVSDSSGLVTRTARFRFVAFRDYPLASP